MPSIGHLEIYSRTRRGTRGTDVSSRSEESHDLHYTGYVFFGGMCSMLTTSCILK